MKTKSKTKKLSKSSKLNPLEKVIFYNLIFYYFLFIEHNDDLVDPYVLDVSLTPPIEVKQPPKVRKVYHLHPLTAAKKVKRLKKTKPKTFKFSLGILVFLFLVIILQVVYPSDRTLPLAHLESHGSLGFANNQQILSALSDFDSRIVTIHTQTKNITTSYKDLGVAIDPEATSKKMTSYPISKRLIPFSIFFYGSKNYEITRSIEDSQLKLFVENVVAQASKKPVDALVTINDTKFSVSPSQEGHEYQISSLKSTVLQADLSDNAQLVFTPTILYPNISSELADTNASRMQQRLDRSITINADGKSITFDSKTIAYWVEIQHKPQQKTLNIIFSEAKIRESLSGFPGVVDYPAKPAVTTMLNGSRVGRMEGSTGKTLQFDELIKEVADTTFPATSSVEASVLTIIPEELIDRRYTKDSLGMQSLLDYWTTVNSGSYGIDVRSLNGRISANINSNKLFPAVGIHKTYIASLIYNRIAGGSINFGTTTQTGESVDVCLNKMVIHSDELCTNALGSIVGWSASDQLLKVQGFESTTLTQGASLSTPNDATDWLIKLSSGNITTVGHSYLLTDLMANQSIRSGLPAGSSGYRVENKSGSYGRAINDIALVYHSGGTYAVSVMSEGSSFAKIADLAYEINRVMSQ